MPRPFLSVVVVLYEMQRAAERTLHSLSTAYQENIEEGEYEVHVVENGSRNPVGRDLVRSYGQNFHYHFLEHAPPSPAYALNYGARKSRGRNLALMIDGAHVLTPKVFAYARQVTQAFDCPVIALRRFYLGPGQQPQTIGEGYNEDIEDQLLDQIGWPHQPYRLFEISTFMGTARNVWFGKMFETNCLILPRRAYRRIGGSDESFHLPGGGFLNLDTFSRSLELPGTQLVVLLGEGSFHQIHGGMTTNALPEEAQRRVQRYRDQYSRIRGRAYTVPDVPIEFFGTLHPHSLLV